MKITSAIIIALASAAQAHYTFPGLIHDGLTEEDWTYVRKTTNFGRTDHGPVYNVSDPQLRCYELEPGSNGAGIMSVKAGDEVGFRVDGNVTHPGPLQFYMAKAPEGETAETFNGDGDVWFKIFHDDATWRVGEWWPSWSNYGRDNVTVTIPPCLAEGDYLLRVEHIAIHNAAHENGAQFYIGCAQLHVSGEGTKSFPGVSIPGLYSATDPGILFDYQGSATSYVTPGPEVISC